MKAFKILSVIAAVVLSIGIVSCGEETDEPKVDPENPQEDPIPTPEEGDSISEMKEVDLGLSVKWCGYNLGAKSPEEYGDYYAWGNFYTQESYTSSSYTFDYAWKYNISGTSSDIAHEQMGGEWRMPTSDEIKELTEKCKFTQITYKDVKGFKITGPNGNSIFMPLAGYKKGTSDYAKNEHGYYWSGTSDGNGNAEMLSLISKGNADKIYHYYGLPIRPVKGLLPDTPRKNLDILDALEYDEMVPVEGGTFNMGAQKENSSGVNYDPRAKYNESPVHQVKLNSFYIGKYEVTQGLWEYVMGYSGKCADGSTMTVYSGGYWPSDKPSSDNGIGKYHPAYNVSWNDIANIFIPRLNRITGKTYRLLTEAEWEYAARGGNKSNGYIYSGANGIDEVGWNIENSQGIRNKGCRTVGIKAPNELGIYDMSGNVIEFCSDWYDEDYYSTSPTTNPMGPNNGGARVFRGGSWTEYDEFCRSSYRNSINPTVRKYYIGFRLALNM